MPLVDDLRRLSVLLPPTFRVSSGEVADILAAAVAHAEHGVALIEAANQGPQAVADFFHTHIVENRPDGAEVPQRGAPVENVPPTGTAPAAPAGPSQADFDRLLGLVEQLVTEQNAPAAEPPASPAPAGESAAPTPAPDAPSGPAEASPPPATPSGGEV